MVRILLIPNVAYHVGRNDLADDSYLEFLNLTIELIKQKRDDLFWYIVIPHMDAKNKEEIGRIVKEKSPTKILDIATGTADIPIYLSKIKNCKITGEIGRAHV